MCSSATIFLLAFALQAHSQELDVNHSADAKYSLDKIVDKWTNKLVDRAVKGMSLRDADLDDTTLSKAGRGSALHTGTGGAGLLRPVMPRSHGLEKVPPRASTRSRIRARKSQPEIIEAEFYDPSDPEPAKPTPRTSKPARLDDIGGSSGSDNFFDKAVKGLPLGIQKFIGQDEKSLQKKKAQAELDRVVDQAFEGIGGGLVGGMAKSLIKGVGGMLAQGLADSAADSERLQEAVKEAIRNDSAAEKELGFNPEMGFPMQQSSSSRNINGESFTMLNQVMPVTSESGAVWVAEVSAQIRDDKLDLQSLLLQSETGRILRVKLWIDGS